MLLRKKYFMSEVVELSVVIPCLNEVETLGICINKSLKSIEKLNVNAEVIVADNGSTDGSLDIAKKYGAKIVNVKNKGYGSALINGIQKAEGKYIIMADADNSYDFSVLDIFYKKLLEGYDLVQGCRFPIGGGKIEKNAMPLSHKYFGNPFLSFISKLFFSLPFNDVYCGFRGFNRKKFLEMNHFSQGMVFAIENLIKFKISGAKCAEIPITLYKDGRKKGKSHLNTLSDGWNTLRFLMVTCPKWLYFFPSFVFLILSFFSLYNFSELIETKKSLVLSYEIFIPIVYFLLGFQFFMFGLFSSLIAKKLKMLRAEFLNQFFSIFKMRYSFSISLFIILSIFIDYYFLNFISIDISLKKILYLFGILFFFLLIINTLFVSLITIDEQK